jgi:MFS family permease
MTDFLPEGRRAEGIGYWGMSTMLAVAVAPGLGFFMYRLGWGWLCAEVALLNLVMAAIASRLDETAVAARRTPGRFFGRHMVEWRVVAVAMALFLCSFGYGGVTSFVAVLAERNAIEPKSIFFTTFAVVVLATRVFSGRLADRVGHRRFFIPCLALVTAGLALIALAHTRLQLVGAAAVFGLGFGNMYPAFVAHVLKFVEPARRGAAFGGILAAFDTGIDPVLRVGGEALSRQDRGGSPEDECRIMSFCQTLRESPVVSSSTSLTAWRATGSSKPWM